jgi:hypothetical protein
MALMKASLTHGKGMKLFGNMTRQETWRQRYRQRPYLKHSTEQAVAERLRYTIENMTTLTQDGKTTLLPPEPNGKYWYELLEHVQEEYRSRGNGPPEGFLRGALVPRGDKPVSAAAIKAVQKTPPLREETDVVKFGMRDRITELHGCGRLRISPARDYSDPSLHSAIHDDELARSTFGLQSEVIIQATDRKTGQLHATKPIGNLTYTSRSKSDYYVYCMSSTLDARLFADFGYNACLIIRDYRKFEQRLSEAVIQQLPSWIGAGGPVKYVDPFNCTKDDASVFFSKHLKYWYQHEYRCVWIPKDVPGHPLEPFFVELGPIRDFSELVVLDDV